MRHKHRFPSVTKVLLICYKKDFILREPKIKKGYSSKLIHTACFCLLPSIGKGIIVNLNKTVLADRFIGINTCAMYNMVFEYIEKGMVGLNNTHFISKFSDRWWLKSVGQVWW